jgi:hypothetical protein
MGVCVQRGTDGMPNAFGAARDPDAKLQRCEAGSEVAALMDCTQRSQAQPGLADGYGRYTPGGFAERVAVAVCVLWDGRQAAGKHVIKEPEAGSARRGTAGGIKYTLFLQW